MIDTLAAQEAWAFTDVDGRIEIFSTGAQHLFRVERLARGDDLLDYFPLPRKALLFDIELALKGWPAERSAIMQTIGEPFTIRYRVSRRLQKSSAGGGLYWHLRTCRPGAR
jgi:hypothetical protein